MRDGNITLVLAKPRNPVPRASPNPIGVARRVSGIYVHAPFSYERRGTIIPLITLYERYERDARPPVRVRSSPNIRMSEYPNKSIRMHKQSDAKTDPSAASIDAPRADGDSRRRSTPVDAADADGRERTRNARRCATRTFSDDATTRIRTRDDEDALERARTLTGRRVGAARDEANARWGSRRRC